MKQHVKPKYRSCLSLGLVMMAAVICRGQVERMEIKDRQPFEGGKAFGAVGPYEQLMGTLHFAVDPGHPQNAAVADLGLATPDEDGKVRYSADFYLIKPLDATKGNGALLFDIPNRGGPTLLLFNYADFQFRSGQSLAGDGFLMNRGFTLMGVGWQVDVASNPSLTVRLHPPRAKGVEGLARADYIPGKMEKVMPLGHWNHVAYEAAAPGDARNVLTVRTSELGSREIVPQEKWRFARLDQGEPVDDRSHLVLEGGFDPGKIYELVYVARDPVIAGLGMTAVRDAVSHMRHHPESPVKVQRVIAFGGSQSGRFLRHFLYQGFLLDLENRPTFDGVFTSVAGAGRGSFNHRFAQASRASLPFHTFFYPTDMFPFACAPQEDPVDNRKEGMLQALARAGVWPKIVQVNTGFEYWGRGASLIHTSADGRRDLDLLPNERIYHVAGSQHFPGAIPPQKAVSFPFFTLWTRYPMNPLNFLWAERALLIALDRWTATDVEPPANRIPRLQDSTLTLPEKLSFPRLPGVDAPKTAYQPRRIDYGPRFQSHGIIDHQPPRVGQAFPVLVPAVDEDGNELGGLRLPAIQVPLATYTPWNYRAEKMGAPRELGDMVGGFFPFPKTRAEREAVGDPRRSLEERYANRTDYLGRFAEAALVLIREGYLLPEDLPAMLEYAGKLWEAVHAPPGAGE